MEGFPYIKLMLSTKSEFYFHNILNFNNFSEIVNRKENAIFTQFKFKTACTACAISPKFVSVPTKHPVEYYETFELYIMIYVLSFDVSLSLLYDAELFQI